MVTGKATMKQMNLPRNKTAVYFSNLGDKQHVTPK